MPRFTCYHRTTALIKHITPRGKTLAFDHRGVLETDEEGAAVLRAHPLYGRLILEEGEPAHEGLPALKTPPAVVAGRTNGRRQSPVSPEALAAREAWAHRKAAMLDHAKVVRARIEASRQPKLMPGERWLLEELRRGGGEVDAAPTIARARTTGITAKRLRTAREHLARTVKRGWKGGWRWVLLDKEAFLTNGAGASLPDFVAGPESSKSPP